VKALFESFQKEGSLARLARGKIRAVIAGPVDSVRAKIVKLELFDCASDLQLRDPQRVVGGIGRLGQDDARAQGPNDQGRVIRRPIGHDDDRFEELMQKRDPAWKNDKTRQGDFSRLRFRKLRSFGYRGLQENGKDIGKRS